MALSDGEPGLWLYDTMGEQRVALTFFEGGEPGLWLADAAGWPRMNLALLNSGPSLWFNDAAGKSRVVLGSTETEHTITGATTRYPISTITLFDETGRVRWTAVALLAASAKRRATIACTSRNCLR